MDPHSPSPALRADYGLDAPGVVRNLLIAAAACLLAFGAAAAGLWSGRIPLGAHVALQLGTSCLFAGVGCAVMAVWMVWTSKVGKRLERERLLDRIEWTGRERVLDVGCGRGLLLIGAARRLSTGEAVGIDLWQAQDLSGNCAEATLENARREGVSERVRLETADMRQLPFPDGSFDVVLSKYAIHNVYAKEERAKALAELARVLAPGGRVILNDIRHLGEYARALRAQGLEVQRFGSPLPAAGLFLLTWGSLHPGSLMAVKR